jgi:hypothetical protein
MDRFRWAESRDGLITTAIADRDGRSRRSRTRDRQTGAHVGERGEPEPAFGRGRTDVAQKWANAEGRGEVVGRERRGG